MISHSCKDRPLSWVTGIITLMILVSCNSSPSTPVTQIIQLTQIVPVTQIVQVPRFVPVTRIVPVTQVVEVIPAIPPAAEAPIMTEAPAATEAPIAFAPAPTPIKPRGNNDLLVWYDFNDDFLTNGMVSDRSGNGFDAQINGTVGTTDGISDSQGILFSGDSYLLAEINPAMGRNTISFSMWFKTDRPEENYKLASAAWWNGGPASGWIIGTHYPEFWSDDTQSLFFEGKNNEENGFLANEWNQEVVTYDGHLIKEYTNGQLVNTWPSTGLAIGTGQAMAIGAWPAFGFNFQGSMDEFKIFTQCLTKNEIQTFYSQGK